MRWDFAPVELAKAEKHGVACLKSANLRQQPIKKLRNMARKEETSHNPYSHLKNFKDTPMHTRATAAIVRIGTRILSAGRSKDAFLRSLIP